MYHTCGTYICTHTCCTYTCTHYTCTHLHLYPYMYVCLGDSQPWAMQAVLAVFIHITTSLLQLQLSSLVYTFLSDTGFLTVVNDVKQKMINTVCRVMCPVCRVCPVQGRQCGGGVVEVQPSSPHLHFRGTRVEPP